MQLIVENLGPINKGTIDLSKRLTILTGANNTGKSYLTYLLYGISKFESMANALSLRDDTYSIFEQVDSVKQAIEHGGTMHLRSIIKEQLPQLSAFVTKHTKDNFNKIFASNSIKADLKIELSSSYIERVDFHFENFVIEDGKLFPVTSSGTANKELFYNKPFTDYNDLKH